MDPRIRQHAEIIANHSVELAGGDLVIVDANPVAEDLVVALHEVIGDHGAYPVTVGQRTHSRARRAHMRAFDGEPETPRHELALVEAADVYVTVRANANATEMADVPRERDTAFRRANQPVREARLATRWNLTLFPGPGDAQLAGMSLEGFETFVWDAVTQDWSAQRAFQERMVERLDAADEVDIRSGDHTDLRMRVGGNPTRNDSAQHNLPGGEVFTAPIPDSVEGTVLFDMPFYYLGRDIEDAYLVFDGGEVVEHRASKNEELLTEILDTDEGSRRLGELGVGMNRAIDRFSYNMLLDEKMGDTIHLALGRAYEDTVGPDNEVNRSAVHADMIVDMSQDSEIRLDGEVVQRNGTFVFEDDFDQR